MSDASERRGSGRHASEPPSAQHASDAIGDGDVRASTPPAAHDERSPSIARLTVAGRFEAARVLLAQEPSDARRALLGAWIALEVGTESTARALLISAQASDDAVASQLARCVARGLDGVSPLPSSIAALVTERSMGDVLASMALAAHARQDEAFFEMLSSLAAQTDAHESLLRMIDSRALRQQERLDEALAALMMAVERATCDDLPRVRARALLAIVQVQAALAPGEAQIDTLVEAETLLREYGALSEQLEARALFRIHGRRPIDRLVSDRVAAALDAVFVAQTALSQPTLDAIEAQSVARGLSNAERVLSTALNQLLAERARSAQLARVLGVLSTITDPAALAQQSVTRARRLFAADGALLVRALTAEAPLVEQRDGVVSAEAPAGCRIGSPPHRAALEGGSLRGPCIAWPLDSEGVRWLVLDRSARGGQFTALDAGDVRFFCEYVAALLARAEFGAQLANAAERALTTVAVLRDGVLAVDDELRLLLANPAASRMLALPPELEDGQRIDAITHLSPLVERLRRRPLPEHDAVQLLDSELVLTARTLPLGGGRDGVALAIVELGKAHKSREGSFARWGFAEMTGEAPEFLRVVLDARAVAPLDTTVLILGESGTGKELFAQAMHNASPRAREPFVAINCAALPRELIEAELFGYERGAFTGARAGGAQGRFEQAGAGTILLDEIGEMPLDLQAKLLRVLQERAYTPVGGSRERPLRARIIATTNRDLEAEVKRGTFRLDLFHRLRVVCLRLPPLRERPGDVARIARRTVREASRRMGKRLFELAPSVIDALERYAWPGNVRELVNVIEGEVALARDDRRVLERIPPAIEAELGLSNKSEAGNTGEFIAARSAGVRTLAEVEREAIIEGLRACSGNVAAAARALGISKVTLYARLKEYGIEPSELRSTEGRRSSPTLNPLSGTRSRATEE
jgi:transcriptional regulator with PAS, ATPase and Fis domain